jgi:hypothetical protein
MIMVWANVTGRRSRVLALVALAASVGACSAGSSSSPVAPDAGPEAAVVDGSADSSLADVVVADVGSDTGSGDSSDASTDAGQGDMDVVDAGADAPASDGGSVGDGGASDADGGGTALPPLDMCDELNECFLPVDDAGDYDSVNTWGLFMAQDYVSALTGDCRVAGLPPTDYDSIEALLSQVARFSVAFFGCSNSTPPPTFDELLPVTAPGTGFTSADVAAVSQDYVNAIPDMLDDIIANSLTDAQTDLIAARMAFVVAAWPGVTSPSTSVYTYNQCNQDAGVESGTDDAGGAMTDGSAGAAMDGGASPDAAVDGTASDGTTSESGIN